MDVDVDVDVVAALEEYLLRMSKLREWPPRRPYRFLPRDSIHGSFKFIKLIRRAAHQTALGNNSRHIAWAIRNDDKKDNPKDVSKQRR
jgi:hypothetical protein